MAMMIIRKSTLLSLALPRILQSHRNHSSLPTSHPISSHRPFWGSFSRLYSSIDDFNLSHEETKRRLFNRLLYRSKQRGYLELDLILGDWVEENINSMDVNGVKALIHVLDLENPDLWKWLTGQEQAPDAIRTNPVFSAVHERVMNNLDKHTAPETRSTPGQAWMRGWDDFKRGRDGPIAGNQ